MASMASLIKRVRRRYHQKSSKDTYGANGLSECKNNNSPAIDSSGSSDMYGANGISECASYLASDTNPRVQAPSSISDGSAFYRNPGLTPYEDVYGESQYFAWDSAPRSGSFVPLERTETWASNCSELDSISGPHELSSICKKEARAYSAQVSELDGNVVLQRSDIQRPNNDRYHMKRLESRQISPPRRPVEGIEGV